MSPPRHTHKVIRRKGTRWGGRGGYHGQVGDQLPEQSPLLDPAAPLGAELARREPAEGLQRVAHGVPGPGGGGGGQHTDGLGALTLQGRERKQQRLSLSPQPPTRMALGGILKALNSSRPPTCPQCARSGTKFLSTLVVTVIDNNFIEVIHTPGIHPTRLF